MAAKHPSIYFHFLVNNFSLTERTVLKKFISRLFKQEKERIDTINYIFCSDEDLLEINKSYLKHNSLTDIVTFQLSSKDEPALSDIYISIDRVKDNAQAFNTTFKRELHRVIFHGALHLCGYKDKTKQDAQIMRSMEEKYLSLYFVPRGTQH